jgi:phosphoglucomutase
MNNRIHALAGKLPPPSLLVDVPKLIDAYYANVPDGLNLLQKVTFGTSGHRGSSLETRFNEWHILAITQAICLFRKAQGIDGPLFLGMDTHALSEPAFQSAMEVLGGNGVTVVLPQADRYTPTPVISHAILTYNKGRKTHFADGIVITPSHNPPDQGGFKYDPPSGGPAEQKITNWIQDKANAFILAGLKGVQRIPFERALKATTTQRQDMRESYIRDLGQVIDMEAIRGSDLRIGVDPLGGAGVHYWPLIAEMHGIHLTVVNSTVDPTFRFMTVDWDGKIRMDPSSSYAMQGLIGLKEQFDIAFACDTDHDRHGIVTKTVGLLPPNHYLSAAILYLFQHRKQWKGSFAVGKTVVSSAMIDWVAQKLGKKVYEVPVGFKWFVEGLIGGELGFAGEESAGASFVRRDGTVWTTDKDGIILALLSAEITAKMGKDPGQIYQDLTHEFGNLAYDLVESAATTEQKKVLQHLSPEHVSSKKLAGDDIVAILTKAPGNQAPIGGVKVITKNGWFAARPSGTEDIYKIYGESFLGEDHLERILQEAEGIVNRALGK